MRYKIDLSNNYKGLLIPGIFFGVGFIILVVFLIISFSFSNKVKNMDSLVEAYNIEEKVYKTDKGETMYRYSFYYMVDDEKYICGGNTSTSEKLNTRNIIIEYNSKNPKECITPIDKGTNKLMAIIGISLGGGFSLISGIILIIMLVNIFKKKRLSKTGLLIKNVPYEMVPSGVTYNGQALYQIEANVKLSNGEMIKVTSSPRYDLKDRDEDGHVDVLIDEKNPKINFVDFNIEEKD